MTSIRDAQFPHTQQTYDGSIYPSRWLLVSTDGSNGRVIVDEDAAADGHLRVVHALEPISARHTAAKVGR
ncbi:hypothetical protein ACIBTW_04940 [Micromonospora parva]|uniref:hypothetical protein n=1 Tax=Micromonospora parva TaxID=1464048 RepID=UPI0037AB8212